MKNGGCKRRRDEGTEARRHEGKNAAGSRAIANSLFPTCLRAYVPCSSLFISYTLPVPINFDAFEAVLLDLDGTVYHEEHALPGAVELIHRLQREGRKYACLTNSTSSPDRLADRLQRMGVEV